MKHILKIFLIFAVLYSILSCSELYKSAETGNVSHNCCNDDAQNGEAKNSCSPLCYCYNNITLVNNSPANSLLDVISIQNPTNTKFYIEGQTESIFRPPEV